MSDPRTSAAVGDPHLWTVILAGGVGSRFWPVSTPARPKQLLPLASDRPLIRDTITASGSRRSSSAAAQASTGAVPAARGSRSRLPGASSGRTDRSGSAFRFIAG